LKNRQSFVINILVLLIFAVCFTLGLIAILSGFVPARWTRFGLSAALLGNSAQLYGAVLIQLGCLPLLMFCRNSKQATWFGSVLFTLLMLTIFGGIYLL
jgi:hypothetical protein